MAATWLADALRAGGCEVDETLVPDWKTRGHTDGPFEPIGVLAHHTAGPREGDHPSLAVVVNGRPGLDGPLANLVLTRAGVFVPVAAGRAWHAGAGSAPWVPHNDGNGYLVGIEAESCGTEDDWTPEQRAAYPLGVAALLRHMASGPDRVLGHKEWAPGRKIDPAFIDMNAFRVQVAGLLFPGTGGGGNAAPIQRPTPAPDAPHPPRMGWPFPAGHYVGDIKGPSRSHGGYFAAERHFVRNVQQWLIYHGCVPGVPSRAWETSGWADGRFEAPYSTAALRTWHARFYPGQPYPEQCWSDDYARLARP